MPLPNIRGLGYTVLAIGLGIGGIQYGMEKKHLSQNRTRRFTAPVTITMDEFIRQSPSDGWYRITDALVFVGGSAYMQSKSGDDATEDGTGRIRTVVAPAYTREQYAGQKRPGLIVITNNLDTRKTLNEMHNLGIGERALDSGHTELNPISATEDFVRDRLRQPIKRDDNKVNAWISANATRIAQIRTVEGLVRTSTELDSDIQSLCHEVESEAAPRHAIIEEGASPQKEDNGNGFIGAGVFFLIVGGISVLSIIANLFR